MTDFKLYNFLKNIIMSKTDLPKLKEKDFLKEIEETTKNLSKIRVVKPSEIEKLKIENNDDFAIADNSYKNIKENIDFLDTYRKDITNPINALSKKVKEMFDNVNAPNLESKTIIQSKMTGYKQVQRQAELAKAKREKEEAEQKAEKQIEEAKRLNRIEHNLYVRLFGGDAIKKSKDGEITKEKKRPCQGTVDVELAIKWIENKFPSYDTFSDEIREDAIRMKELFLMVANNLKRAFFDAESDHPATREEALNTIMQLNSDYHSEVEARKEERKSVIKKGLEQSEKTIEKKAAESKKGFRKDIVWEVLNLELVDDKYKTLDDSKVRDYKTVNRDNILKAIKEGKGHEILPGLKFSVKEKYIG